MQVIILIALLFLIVIFNKGKQGFMNRMSMNLRILLFSLIIGVILRTVSLAVGANKGYYSESPSFLFTIVSSLSSIAFGVAIICLIIGIYRFFFQNKS